LWTQIAPAGVSSDADSRIRVSVGRASGSVSTRVSRIARAITASPSWPPGSAGDVSHATAVS
jgi:hypothetical protein